MEVLVFIGGEAVFMSLLCSFVSGELLLHTLV